jgi:hypothetical protein
VCVCVSYFSLFDTGRSPQRGSAIQQARRFSVCVFLNDIFGTVITGDPISFKFS